MTSVRKNPPITFGDMRATLDRADKMIRHLRDEQELIPCSDDDDDICNMFDLVLDQMDALSTRFDEARSKESVMVDKMIESSQDRHEVDGILLEFGDRLDGEGRDLFEEICP